MFSYYDVNNLENGHSVKHTTTRIRVNSYGPHIKQRGFWYIDEQKRGIAFNLTIANAEYSTQLGSKVRCITLRAFMEAATRLQITEQFEYSRLVQKKLTSFSDENAIQDNQSPYILIPSIIGDPNSIRHVDMGQIFFGFESLILPVIGNGYFHYFQIADPNDLTGIVANIATDRKSVV